MVDARKTRNDLLLSFGSQFVYKVIGFGVLALLARHLAQEDFGRLLFGLSFAGVFVLFTEFGSCTWLIREVSAHPAGALARTSDVIVLRLPLIGVFLVVVTAAAAVTKPELVGVIAALSVFVGLKDLHRTFSAMFLGLKRVACTVVVYGTAMLVLFGAVLFAVRADRGLATVIGAYVLCGMTLIVMSLAVTRGRVGRLRLRWRPDVARVILRRSFPLFALAVLALVHFSADTLMLGYLRPYDEVAEYEAGAKLLEASQFLVRPATLIFFPICAELAARNEFARLRMLARRLPAGAALLGVVLAAGVGLAAPWIIPTVYGKGYESSVEVLRVLYLGVPALYVTIVATFLCVSMHRERPAMTAMAAGVTLNIALNAFAIPRWGPVGCAWTTLVSQSLTAGMLVVLAWRGPGAADATGRRLTVAPGAEPP